MSNYDPISKTQTDFQTPCCCVYTSIINPEIFEEIEDMKIVEAFLSDTSGSQPASLGHSPLG